MGFSCQAQKKMHIAWEVFPWTILGLNDPRYFCSNFCCFVAYQLIDLDAEWKLLWSGDIYSKADKIFSNYAKKILSVILKDFPRTERNGKKETIRYVILSIFSTYG